MPFEEVLGQTAAMATLARALERGKVHHAYRFEGPEGVGKERAALAFAQALVCTAGVLLGCGVCDACRRAVSKSARPPEVPLHPDVIFVGRALYPPELIGGKKEASEISVEQVRRVVLTRVVYPPHEARHQVIILRGAEELSANAANALLKTLEEPRPRTHFVLLTSQPDVLLDTIRSRTMPVRFGPLPDAVLRTILLARGLPEESLSELCALAGGSASAALELADPERRAARENFVQGVLGAMRTPGLGAAVVFAEGVERDRPWLIESLGALAAIFVERARSFVAQGSAGARVQAERHALVVDAMAAIERNGQASLVMSGLVASLKAARQLRPGRPPAVPVPRR